MNFLPMGEGTERLAERLSVLAENLKFLKRGVSHLDEVVFSLRRD